MQKHDFARRTMLFGLRIIRLVEQLPKSQVARVIGSQLLRAGTSVGAK
jgi:four helix bundle protein